MSTTLIPVCDGGNYNGAFKLTFKAKANASSTFTSMVTIPAYLSNVTLSYNNGVSVDLRLADLASYNSPRRSYSIGYTADGGTLTVSGYFLGAATSSHSADKTTFKNMVLMVTGKAFHSIEIKSTHTDLQTIILKDCMATTCNIGVIDMGGQRVLTGTVTYSFATKG